jgi:RNA polymerase sigma factor (sigma-70 family)
MSRALLETILMSTPLADPRSGQRRATEFGEAEGQELASLFRSWREDSGLAADEERRFAVLLNALVTSRAAGALEAGAFLRLVEPFAGPVELGDEEKQSLLRRVKPLIQTRELTKEEKDELAGLFERYRMRLTSKLRRSIGAALEAEFDADDVLNEAYIRAETRWFARPAEPERYYVWIYGIVHDQLYDMLRKVNAVKRGGRLKEVSLPDNSAAEIALEFGRSQTGASTIAERKELVSRLRGFLERSLDPTDLEIFLMRVFDRLEYPEIAAELVRRVEGATDRAVDYRNVLAELDSRSQNGDHPEEGHGKDANKRRADAIRKRFTRAVQKLTGAIISEFPELLDALPSLKPGQT